MPLRYAILHHTGIPDPHFDLLFETFPGSDLTTWRSPNWPLAGPTHLLRIKDHRRAYLDFEGELTQRRGRVERVAGGRCEVEVGPAGRWTVRFLDGSRPTALEITPVAGDGWRGEPHGHAKTPDPLGAGPPA